MNHAERAELLQDALEAAGDGDKAIRDLTAALARQIPGLGDKGARELLARIGWHIVESNGASRSLQRLLKISRPERRARSPRPRSTTTRARATVPGLRGAPPTGREDALEAHVADYAPRTAGEIRRLITRFTRAAGREWWECGPGDVAEFLAGMRARGCLERSVKEDRRRLWRFYEWCIHHELIDDNPVAEYAVFTNQADPDQAE